jgi:hypothetical protein
MEPVGLAAPTHDEQVAAGGGEVDGAKPRTTSILDVSSSEIRFDVAFDHLAGHLVNDKRAVRAWCRCRT